MLESKVFKSIKDYQDKLMAPLPVNLTEEHLSRFRNLSLALNQEVAELVDSAPWKPWRPIEDQQFDLENMKREIADCVFFLVEIANVFGITNNELKDKFEWVLYNNLCRLENGYNKTEETEETNE